MGIDIRFWGVRGSIASPGPRTAGVGGNTSCVEVRCGDRVVVLDVGTGARGLGDRLAREGVEDVQVLLSHLHWDHIQGLPFFAPAWIPGRRVTMRGAPSTSTPGLSLEGSIAAQMMPPHFPVRLEDMRATIAFEEIALGRDVAIDDVIVRAARLAHPGGVLGWRIEHAGRSVVYATDTEHVVGGEPDATLVELARDADVLIYDAMDSDEEHATRIGWGHSTWSAGVAVADAARVGQLVLFHHDPQRDDDAVEAIERVAAERRHGTIAAREGMVIGLGGRSEARAA
ncbi:MBL fold metallo-hydrolase [Sandaracinus amylolyticus]|uniref:MBL fold metallo-hydrolase n=1 Tax=Sandaracinus amylolyticus TaxID=927083 RepID=UPI001F1715D5|nr:MBL fold metallo-hydrolase [Sandaracinus amylolyticus]UJR80025.1 MBL fold metallo-hydrolase [Sandaracinus amylolyticus]